MNPTIKIDPILSKICPELKLGVIECEVNITENNADLWKEIDKQIGQIEQEVTVEDIREKPSISSSKNAYRKVGKDPNRYRLSAESLLRRIVNGKGLYKINNVVDLLNLVSIKSGFSIGGYNADKIVGNITMGLGRADEEYQGIGRGQLNIENLPIFRDELGAFGSATSDSLRTQISLDCQSFLMVFFSYQGEKELSESMAFAENLLVKYAEAKELKKSIL